MRVDPSQSNELAIAIKSLGHTVTESDLHLMIQEIDPNCDDQHIEFPCFVSIMMRNIKSTPGKSNTKRDDVEKHNKKVFSKSSSSFLSQSSFHSFGAAEEDDMTVATEGGDRVGEGGGDKVQTRDNTSPQQGISAPPTTTTAIPTTIPTTATATASVLKTKKSSLLPSRGSKVWVLGEDSEWRLGTLERVKKPVVIHERRVVALHVTMDIPPPVSAPLPDEGEEEEEGKDTPKELRSKVVHTHFENAEETEYVLVKRTSRLSGESAVKSPLTPELLCSLDLSVLPVVNEPEILYFLRQRYECSCRFFSVGPLMLAFTVHKRSGPSSQQLLKELPYFANNDVLMDGSAGVGGLVQKMCAHLCPMTGSSGVGSSGRSAGEVKHQAVLLQGESGSGKSTFVNEMSLHVVSTLACFSETKPEDIKIDDSVLFQINTILETFGHAQTPSNPSSSRYSKSVKFSIDSSTQELTGLLVRCYSLELHRVSQCPSDDCNFNVFYDVFDDVFFSEVASEKFAIDEITSFKYTPNKPASRLNEPGKSRFRDLTKALLELLGIPKKNHRVLYGVLAAILHLGEVVLEEGEEEEGGGAMVVYAEGE
jgi:hypothetical protein